MRGTPWITVCQLPLTNGLAVPDGNSVGNIGSSACQNIRLATRVTSHAKAWTMFSMMAGIIAASFSPRRYAAPDESVLLGTFASLGRWHIDGGGGIVVLPPPTPLLVPPPKLPPPALPPPA